MIHETYLKTQQVADALGVSVSTIQRWVDNGSIIASRTVGKHRRVLLSSVLDYARRERISVESLLSMAHEVSVVEIDTSTVGRLVSLLKLGRVGEASALIQAASRSSRGAVGLADDLIRPAMDLVGHGWMVGAWDIYQEHQATQTVLSAVADLSRRIADESCGSARPLALGGSTEGDPYSLPGVLSELVLREAGWDVRNLGVGLPLKSLAMAIRDYRPGLVFLSVSQITDRARFITDYAYFYEAATKAGAAIILGGRALDADLRSKLIYASFGERMSHLAEFARRLLPASGLINHQKSTNVTI